MLNITEIYNKDATEVALELARECYIKIPTNIEHVEDLIKAGNMLGELTNKYSYLMSLFILLEAEVKKYKPIDKIKYSDLVTKRDVVHNSIKMVSQQYSGISRLISTKQEVDKEMNFQ